MATTRSFHVGDAFGDDDRYMLLEHLGQGQHGEVWRARDTHRNMVVAIKILFEADPAAAWREASTLTEMESPHILRVNNVGIVLDVPFIDTFLAEGGSTAEASRPYGVVPRTAVDWTRQMLRGLHLCHQRRVLHRDVKPDNVFLTAEGKAQLGDFGIAAIMYGDGTAPAHGDSRICAPEVLRGENCSVSSDIYSAGMTLYSLLVGDIPAQRTPDLPDVRDIAPHVSRGLAKIVRAATAADPQARYDSAAQFDETLGRLSPSRRSIVRVGEHEGHISCWLCSGSGSGSDIDVCVLAGPDRIVTRHRASGNRILKHCVNVRTRKDLLIGLRRVFDAIR